MTCKMGRKKIVLYIVSSFFLKCWACGFWFKMLLVVDLDREVSLLPFMMRRFRFLSRNFKLVEWEWWFWIIALLYNWRFPVSSKIQALLIVAILSRNLKKLQETNCLISSLSNSSTSESEIMQKKFARHCKAKESLAFHKSQSF